jgi:hypothetical protein
MLQASIAPVAFAATRTQPPAMAAMAVRTSESSTVLAQPSRSVALPVTAISINPSAENLHLVQPDLDPETVPRPVTGLPRAQVKGPMAPGANVTDEMLLEDAADSVRKLYVPRYRVATQNVSGQQRYRMSLEPAGNEWTLTVHLERFPAPAIEQAARTANEIQHSVAVILMHTQMISGQAGAEQELAFQEITEESGGVRATLRIGSLPERDLLYSVLTDRSYAARLVVRRVFNVAVPALGLPPGPRATPGLRHPPVADPDLPKRRPVLMVSTMVERPDILVQGSASAVQPSGPLYRDISRALDITLDPNPFIFAPALHGYIFGGITVAPGQSFELIRRQTSYKGNAFSYYQDAAQPWVFYYLPDRFKVARHAESPHTPMMSIRLTAADGSVGSVQLEYIAVPCVDIDRLQAAAGDLKAFVTGPAPAGVNVPAFEPMLAPADKVQLRLAVADSGGGGGPFGERPGATVDLGRGIRDSLTLSMDQFRPVYDALFGSSQILFTGTVSVDLPGDAGESIPFSARLNDLAGELFDYQESATHDGGFHANLRNGIESPVKIARLSGTVASGPTAVPAVFQNLDLSSPLILEPGSEVSFDVHPASPLSTNGPVTVAYDLRGVEVLPNQDAVLQAILDPSVPPVYMKTVTLQTFKPMFDPPPGHPENQVMAIAVDFENGPSVSLTPDKLQADAKVPRPVTDFLLAKADAGQYRYKVRLEHVTGETADTTWRTDNRSLLFPNLAQS